MAKRIVVLVHGWSVRDTSTYGELPQRLKSEARADGLDLDIRNIWLSRYITFHNEVRIEDIARALEAALRRELGKEIARGRRLVMITHSTGGPVARSWLQHYYFEAGKRPPVSHLIMLAPANFGSALAQLGMSRVSRLKAWFEGVEPGLGVLDWLELGSPDSLALNESWIENGAKWLKQHAVYPFVLAGQSIDHKAYDHVNAYTGEMGSDGVVRTSAANLNADHVTLVQAPMPRESRTKLLPLTVAAERRLDGIAFALIPGRSHSGDSMGIMRSVRDNGKPHPTIAAIRQCLGVKDRRGYQRVVDAFAKQTGDVQAAERVEVRDLPGPFDHTYIKDPGSMVIFRVRDDAGRPVEDFDLKLTAGPSGDPDRLPPGFLIDRQRNHRDPATLTLYFNAARMLGSPVLTHDGHQVRPALPPCEGLGLRIVPYPLHGFVHYVPANLEVDAENLARFAKPNHTIVVDVVLRRVVHEGVYRLSRKPGTADFTDTPPGPPVRE